MDDYRFRAWHYPSKKMVYMHWSDERALYTFNFKWKRIQREYALSHILFNPEFKPMIYVGVKDRNGRDMYERDLVRQWRGDDELPVVALQHTAPFWWDSCGITAWEIVGNTFEGVKNDR